VIGRRRPARRAALGTPVVVVAPALIGVLFLLVPTVALIWRTPWHSIGRIYRENQIWAALRISIETSLLAVAASLVVGVPLAWVLARTRGPGVGLLRAIVIIPLVLPPVISGVGLFDAFGRFGVLGGEVRSLFGAPLPFTFPAIVVAQAFVAMPFLVITVEGAFRVVDVGVEEAAATLGASRSRVFTHVTLPVIAPAVVLGAVLCWARALGEFGATLLFAGNLSGPRQTLPSAVLYVFDSDPSQAPALALPLMLVALVVLGVMRDRWLRPAFGASS
jgi:molybdate transport system permease protein